MFLYLPGVSALVVFYVFNSKGIDYRAVALGSLLPIFIDSFIGHASFGHSFIFPIGMLVVIMLITINRSRMLRRRLLSINIGLFLTLILQGTFLHESMWWWPFDTHSVNERVSIFPSLSIWIIRDIVGIIALYILISVGELYRREKLNIFLRSGRIAL